MNFKMGMQEQSFHQWPPIGAPLTNMHHHHHHHHHHQQQLKDESMSPFNSSANALSFGFVATAVLISMFLVIAVFERFLRPASPELSPSGRRRSGDVESQLGFNGKLGHPSPKMSVYARGVTVLMPGDDIPSYIAHPVPAPCPPERAFWPPHRHISLPSPASSSRTRA